MLNVAWKFAWIAVNASAKRALARLVDARDGLDGLRDRIDQVLALRRQEHVARFELVELLDGHHVHRTEAVDLRFQRDDGFFGAHANRDPGSGFARRVRGSRVPGSAGSSASGSGSSAVIAAASGRGLARALHLFDVREHRIERHLHGIARTICAR